jgi:hypothetical protein
VIYFLKGGEYTTVDKVIAEVDKLEGKTGSGLGKNDLF